MAPDFGPTRIPVALQGGKISNAAGLVVALLKKQVADAVVVTRLDQLVLVRTKHEEVAVFTSYYQVAQNPANRANRDYESPALTAELVARFSDSNICFTTYFRLAANVCELRTHYTFMGRRECENLRCYEVRAEPRVSRKGILIRPVAHESV